MSKAPKAPRDINQNAHRTMLLATGQAEPDEKPDTRNPAAVALGKLGGAKGGKARAKKLTKKQRVEIATIGASARWKKKR